MSSIYSRRIGFLAVFVGCASVAAAAPTVHPTQLAAPIEQAGLPAINVIAVGSIDGSGGREVADDLSEALVETGRFRVVDRAQTERILREHRLRSSGLLRPDETRRLGQFLGADAYIMGSVTAHRTERFTSSITGTPETRAIVEFHAEVIDLRTAEVLASRRVSHTESSETDLRSQAVDRLSAWLRGDKVIRSVNAGALLARARRRVAADFAMAVAQ